MVCKLSKKAGLSPRPVIWQPHCLSPFFCLRTWSMAPSPNGPLPSQVDIIKVWWIQDQTRQHSTHCINWGSCRSERSKEKYCHPLMMPCSGTKRERHAFHNFHRNFTFLQTSRVLCLWIFGMSAVMSQRLKHLTKTGRSVHFQSRSNTVTVRTLKEGLGK